MFWKQLKVLSQVSVLTVRLVRRTAAHIAPQEAIASFRADFLDGILHPCLIDAAMQLVSVAVSNDHNDDRA